MDGVQAVSALKSSKHIPDIKIAVHNSGKRVAPVAHVHIHVRLGRRIDRAVIKPGKVCSLLSTSRSTLWPTRPTSLRGPLGSSLRSTAVPSSREGAHVDHF